MNAIRGGHLPLVSDWKERETAVIIGGGIVGIYCALYLQRSGYSVTLVDPSEVGDSTAKWSCGQISVGEIIPLCKPGILTKAPGWLADQSGPLALRPSALPRILPWFLRFVSCARHSRINEIAYELASLTRHAFADYAPLLEACDDQALLMQRPVLEVFDSIAALERKRVYNEARQTLGFASQELNAAEIGGLEPALAGRFSHGLLLPQWRFVSDTEAFIVDLTNSFLSGGGRRVKFAADQIDESGGRATGVTLTNGDVIAASHVVVAAGVGSRRLFRQLGVNVPLEAVAGYQTLLVNPGVHFVHSVIYADGGFCFTPMTRGLQIGGTIEFAGPNAAPNFRRAEIILKRQRRFYRSFVPNRGNSVWAIARSCRIPSLLSIGHDVLRMYWWR